MNVQVIGWSILLDGSPHGLGWHFAFCTGNCASPRTGAFAGYDLLKTYYVGQGGNYNSSTRLRRYVGRPGDRPMLPQHDLKDARALLQPNRWVHVQLVAYGDLVQYWADGRKLFEMRDPDAYTATMSLTAGELFDRFEEDAEEPEEGKAEATSTSGPTS